MFLLIKFAFVQKIQKIYSTKLKINLFSFIKQIFSQPTKQLKHNNPLIMKHNLFFRHPLDTVCHYSSVSYLNLVIREYICICKVVISVCLFIWLNVHARVNGGPEYPGLRNIQTRNHHISCVKFVYCSGRRSKQRIQGHF